MSRERFLKAYANLPPPERAQVIVLLDDEPYSWARAYAEVKGETKTGKRILHKLAELEIL